MTDCSCAEVVRTWTRCETCPTGSEYETHSSLQWIKSKQMILQNQARVPASQYTSALTATTVRGPVVGAGNNNPIATYSNVNWNQSSDRAIPSMTLRYVPTRGNSTKSSLTRCRPGAACPGGTSESAKGVDVKHNSYARYLARKKAGPLRQKEKANANPANIYDQTYYTQYSLMRNIACKC